MRVQRHGSTDAALEQQKNGLPAF